MGGWPFRGLVFQGTLQEPVGQAFQYDVGRLMATNGDLVGVLTIYRDPIIGPQAEFGIRAGNAEGVVHQGMTPKWGRLEAQGLG